MMAEDKSIIFNNILVLTEVVSVKSHMKVKVILRVTGGAILQQGPLTETNNTAQVLPTASHKFLRQHREKTPRH
jgi:hypothetical protein